MPLDQPIKTNAQRVVTTFENKATGRRHKFVRVFKLAYLIEFEDALFRTGSAVMMPDQGAPAQGADEGGLARTGAGVTASVLRYAEEHPGRKVLVAGHTDSVGSADFNQTLSEYRAACVSAVLLGERDVFVQICNEPMRRKVSDYKQILAWAALTRGWACDPGPVNDQHTDKTWRAILEFQKAYNREGAGAGRMPRIAEDGVLGKQTWGAFFDCYEDAIGGELGTDAAGLAPFRAGLAVLHEGVYVGCGEHHPLEAENVDEYRSQSNRRVEVLFIDPGQEPVLACHASEGCEPDACDLYNPHKFRRVIVPSMPSALPWPATWDEPVAHADEERTMVLTAPGLPAGETMLFEVSQVGYGPVDAFEVLSEEGRATAPFAGWYGRERVRWTGDVENGAPFPEVRFEFTVSGAGREIKGGTILYADELRAVLYEDDGATPAQRHEFTLCSPWGTRRKLYSDAEGRVRHGGLPPGGAYLFLDDGVIVEFEEAGIVDAEPQTEVSLGEG